MIDNDRKPKSPADPRRRILDAAYREFANKGMKGARTREIAAAAGVNIAMVHYYFGSKEKLYWKVTRPVFRTLVESLKSTLTADDDPVSRVEALVDAYFDFLKKHPDFPRLVLWETLTGGKNLKMIFQGILKDEKIALADEIAMMFRSAGETGMFVSVDPAQAMVSLVGLCVFPFAARDIIQIVFRESALDEEFIEERRRHVKQLLIRGLSVQGKR
jgi:AcrR family transcriptional regulator